MDTVYIIQYLRVQLKVDLKHCNGFSMKAWVMARSKNTTFALVTKAVAIVILICLVVQSTIQLGILGYYQANKEYITRNFCVNKDKPQLHCNGKCHLKKLIKKADREQDQSGSRVNTEQQVTVFILPAQQQLLHKATEEPVTHKTCYTTSVYTSPLNSVFHPPPSLPLS